MIRDNIPDNFSNRDIFSLTKNRLMLINLQSNSDYIRTYEIKIEIKKKSLAAVGFELATNWLREYRRV